MIEPIRRRRLLHAGLALCASVAVPTARACEFFAPNLRVVHPWTRATTLEDGFAVLCMGFDQVTLADRLIGVETPMAGGAEMGGPGAGRKLSFAIPAGRESLLSETGPHVRLVRLKQPLELGRSYPLKLVFEKGGVVAADFEVDYERMR